MQYRARQAQANKCHRTYLEASFTTGRASNVLVASRLLQRTIMAWLRRLLLQCWQVTRVCAVNGRLMGQLCEMFLHDTLLNHMAHHSGKCEQLVVSPC
jgi:hypothetical protein